MTKKELEDGLAEIQREARLKELDLKSKYALANNPYKIGDIVTDHYHTVKIEKIGVYGTQCVYYGTELKIDLTPKKKQENTTIYQSHIKSKQ